MKELINKYIGGVQKHRLKIETLTPVTIRNGEILSPLTDYHIEGNRLYLLDTDKLMADIDQNNWLDDFESKVLEYSGNHSGGTETNAKKKNRFIADFLKEKGASIKSYLKEENARNCQLKSEAEWVQLHSTIKTENKAYIPGSSIKGAIRTAIMYQWLTDTEEGKEKLASFLDTNKKGIENWAERINRKTKGNKNNAKKKDEITKELKKEETERKAELLKLLHGFEEEVANVVFGKSEGEYNASTYFKVLDSRVFENSDLRISSLQKKYRKDEDLKKEFTTSLQEFIDKGKETVIEISVSNLSLDWRENRGCTYFAKCIKERKQLDKVFEAINSLSRDFLEFEICRLNAFKESEKSKTSYSKENLDIYHNMLENLYNQLKENNLNSAITCIGFGKSIFMNTVLLVIRTENYGIFTNIVKVLHASHPRTEHFPFSYYATSIDSQDYPLGWVKITDINKDAYQQEYDLPDFKRANLEKDSIIQGVLLELNPIPKVQVSIDGEKQYLNANGLSKLKKESGVIPQIGATCSLQITAIKEGEIKDIKIISI